MEYRVIDWERYPRREHFEYFSAMPDPYAGVTVPVDITQFLAACKGARAAKMRVVGVYDSFFSHDEKEMLGFCDVFIRSFEELLLPERKRR